MSYRNVTQTVLLLLVCFVCVSLSSCSTGFVFGFSRPTKEDNATDVRYLQVEGSCGGYVFYDKGFYSDGWRYLEAAPADLKLINGTPSINVEDPGYDDATERFVFGFYRTYPDYQDDLFVNGTRTYWDYDCTQWKIGSGKRNTELIVKAMRSSAFTEDHGLYYHETGLDKTSQYAAKLCNDLVYKVGDKEFDDWFLPSTYELKLLDSVYSYKELGTGGIKIKSYWSSTETPGDPSSAYQYEFDDMGGNCCNLNRGGYRWVRPVRAF